jgi:hypothetical protein
LHTQENHDLQIMLALHNQQLKEEEAIFDRIIRKASFASKEAQREIDNAVTKREQTRKHEQDLTEIAIKAAKIEEEDRLERIKAKNEFEVRLSRLEVEKNIQMERIAAEERCRIAAALAK